jgi:alpha-tubulin suppressor-like RCC1 family protein
VAGAAAGDSHTVEWTDTGELFTFGNGGCGRLGHKGGLENELVPRLIEAL